MGRWARRVCHRNPPITVTGLDCHRSPSARAGPTAVRLRCWQCLRIMGWQAEDASTGRMASSLRRGVPSPIAEAPPASCYARKGRSSGWRDVLQTSSSREGFPDPLISLEAVDIVEESGEFYYAGHDDLPLRIRGSVQAHFFNESVSKITKLLVYTPLQYQRNVSKHGICSVNAPVAASWASLEVKRYSP
jgi:hypothetical protein